MAKRKKFKCTSEAQKRAIRASYAKRAAEQKKNAVGKVYRGETKFIDKEPKKQRDYAVVRDCDGKVTVAKLKTVKIFDETGKNADPALVEINHERYGLPNRTGVDFQRFDKNRMSGKPLRLDDKEVFPEDKERFTLGGRDTERALRHTRVITSKTPKKPKK